jgi:hypothetical protein
MRLIRQLPELLMVAAIVLSALINVAVWGGFVVGENARAGAAPASELPPGNAPGTTDSPRVRALSAEVNESPDLPGVFVPSQGRQHLEGSWPLDERMGFCATPEEALTGECYSSNPPSSGLHLGNQRNVELETGQVITIPPEPGIYDFEIPRESIPHLQEHAGVYLGYHCATSECDDIVRRITEVVADELRDGARVVMAPSTDFFPNTIALASWTRVDVFQSGDFTEDRVRRFIEAHSCRFDPEGFCS